MKKVGLALAGVLLVIAIVTVYLSRSGGARQPLRFSHKAHLEEVMCGACHPYYEEHASAGMPRLEDCLDCHEGGQSEDPEGIKEEEKLAQYFERNEEIRWVRLYHIPDHSFFSHRRHVVLAKLECESCHGDIAKSDVPPERPVQPVTMASCVSCHQAEDVTVDCNACHR